MSDELNTGEIIEREEITTPPKRGRGRPRKTESADAIFDGQSVESKPRRGRRSAKLTADHVANMISMSSTMIVVGTGHDHWYIQPIECAPFAGQLAELFNRIPSRYVKAFVDLNGYVIVAFGLYNVIQPRLKVEAQLRHQERMESQRDRREELVRQESMGWDIPTTTKAEA